VASFYLLLSCYFGEKMGMFDADDVVLLDNHKEAYELIKELRTQIAIRDKLINDYHVKIQKVRQSLSIITEREAVNIGLSHSLSLIIGFIDKPVS
jgi:hypothetical protein